MLTTAQQDYLETIHRLESQSGEKPVTISKIAEVLGTRLPTVTRSVRKLTEMGLIRHRPRRDVRLSASGKRIASEILHRHNDIVEFLTEILGVDSHRAESDCCQMEHGMSGKTAQRLHEFLFYVKGLSKQDKPVIASFRRGENTSEKAFRHLPQNKTSGWRS